MMVEPRWHRAKPAAASRAGALPRAREKSRNAPQGARQRVRITPALAVPVIACPPGEVQRGAQGGARGKAALYGPAPGDIDHQAQCHHHDNLQALPQAVKQGRGGFHPQNIVGGGKCEPCQVRQHDEQEQPQPPWVEPEPITFYAPHGLLQRRTYIREGQVSPSPWAMHRNCHPYRS